MNFLMNTLATSYRHTARACADLLFPLLCAGCGKEGAVLCAPCEATIEYAAVLRCPWCAAPRAEGSPCKECALATRLKSVHACFDYRNVVIARLIVAWKYEGINEAFAHIRASVAGWAQAHPRAREMWRDAVLVPIPLHRRRVCERGFNQAEFLSLAFADVLGVPVSRCLERTVYSAPQARQTGAARRSMPADMFAIKKNVSPPRIAVLVDDVYTTGATLERAADVLLRQGTKEVYGLVYARET